MEDPAEKGMSSTVGTPEISIGIIKKRLLLSKKGGELGLRTRIMEYPGFIKYSIPISQYLDVSVMLYVLDEIHPFY